MTRPFRGQSPTVPDSAFIDPTAVVIGKVTLGEHVGVWPNTTIRGDVADITIGDESNIQDNCCLHVDRGEPLVVGRRCVVGHSVTLHACEIEDGCLIGMGATVLSRSKIGAGSIIAAGALVVEGAEIPPRSLVAGVPGKVRRQTTDEELERIRRGADGYMELAREHRKNV